MSKTVAIKMRSAPATTADAWVRRSAGEEVAEPMKRFTIDVPRICTSASRRAAP
jgi:hypothetical protein